MTWAQFQAGVSALLGPEAIRRGIAALVAQHTANAVIDLQRYIPSFRQGNSTSFLAANLTVQSKAMVGSMPLGAKVKAFYIYSNATGDDPNCKRYKLDYYPWSKRQDIICGRLDFKTWWGCCGAGGPCPPFPPACSIPTDPTSLNPWGWCEERAYVYTISPHLDSFVIYPPLNPYDTLLMVWDGFKSTFSPTDVVPYPIEATEAVAAYVLTKVRKQIDRDLNLANSSQTDYLSARRALIREWRDNQVTDGQDDEYLTNLIPPPAESLIMAGAQAVPLLQSITAIAGTTPNCLQAIATAAFTGPTAVLVRIGGLTQMWICQAGVDATDVPNGICQAGDWAVTGNVWYQGSI